MYLQKKAKINLSNTHFQSPSCTADNFLVSKSGSPQLSGAASYCGRGTLSITSTSNSLSIGKSIIYQLNFKHMEKKLKIRIEMKKSYFWLKFLHKISIITLQCCSSRSFTLFLGLITKAQSQGGKFLCSLTAVKVWSSRVKHTESNIHSVLVAVFD